MRIRSKALLIVPAAVAASLALGACGGDDSDETADDTSGTSEQVQTAPTADEECPPVGEEEYVDDFDDQLEGAQLLGALRDGGYIVFFRHTQTERDYADQADPDLVLGDCSTQRVLSEDGWQDARAIGAAFEDQQIPVGDVISSQYCRAWQTADLAFGSYEQRAELNFEPAEEYTEEQVQAMSDNLTPLLSAKPAAGENTILVGHDDVFESATGIYPEPQGVAYVVEPQGNGFELVARLDPDEWESLSG
jgi:phosphohistidine phosphatase SixA